jgi:ornithine carbamoyltransferase
MKRDFLSIPDFSREEIMEVLELASKIKDLTKSGNCPQPFKGKAFGLIFHKPSLRTRISFETGIFQLGGHPLFITDKEIELGKREAISDVARVMSRYLSCIIIRTFDHRQVEELARWAAVPVVNALTDLLHPCQVMGDLLTIQEHKGKIEGINLTYLGDGNNVANSLLNAAYRLPLNVTIATSPDTLPNMEIFKRAQNSGRGKVRIVHHAEEGVKGADIIYADVWASMGQKDKAEEKSAKLHAFQVNEELLSHSKKEVLVMHCLPAERGREITDEVMDGPHSIVFDQAENRLHIQKAILMKIVK